MLRELHSRRAVLMRIIFSWALVACLLVRVVAQVPKPDSRPSFEVASVKPHSASEQALRSLNVGPDSLSAANISAFSLITRAYGVTARQVAGLPPWARTELFDIRAKAQRTTSRVEMFEMLRSLLEDRFKLRAHLESRVVDVYVLRIDRAKYPGSGLHPIVIDCATETLDPSSGPGLFPSRPRMPCEGVLSGRDKETTKKGIARRDAYLGVTLSKFADMLEGQLNRHVRDQTGVEDVFDIELNYPDTLMTTPAPPGIALFTPNEAMIRDVVRAQLGLTLSAGHAPVEFVIVDSIQRPTPD